MGYRANDKVEIYGESDGFEDTYFEAKIIRRVQAGLYRVEYKELLNDDGDEAKVEDVWENRIRPLPYPVIVPEFIVGDAVEVKYINDGWWIGVVSSIDLPRYGIRFKNFEDEFWYDFNELRIHQVKIGRTWTYDRQMMFFEQNEDVEICSLNDGLPTITFYDATIVRHISGGLYRVRYKYLLNDNGRGRLDDVMVNRIRPVPYPVIIPRFKVGDEVDVNEGVGWCKGVISSPLGNEGYGVRFENVENELRFEFNLLRIHQKRNDRTWNYVKY